MREIQVVHLLHKLTFGGTEQVIANLLNHSGPKAHHFICSFYECDEAFRKEISNWENQTFSLHKKDGNDLSVPLKLARFCRENSIDIIHSLGWGTYAEGLLASILNWRTTRFIHSFRGKTMEDTVHIPRRRLLAQKFFSLFCNAIIVPSDVSRQEYASMIGINTDKISIIYNGVDTSKFNRSNSNYLQNELNLPQEALVIGSVARFDPVKNIDGLIHAFAGMSPASREGCRLLLVGDGPERERLEQEAKSLHVRDQVVFAGMSSEVEKFLRLMDLYVQPSHFEGVPNAVLEAMAAGLPVLATNVGGVPEIVQHEKTGLIVPPKDQAALSQAMEHLIANEGLRRTLGSQGAQIAASKFSIQKMVADYEGLFERIISGQKRGMSEVRQ